MNGLRICLTSEQSLFFLMDLQAQLKEASLRIYVDVIASQYGTK